MARNRDRVERGFVVSDCALVGLALQRASAGRTQMADDILELNLHAFPSSIDSITLLAHLRHRSGRHESAAELLESALALAPESTSAARLKAEMARG